MASDAARRGDRRRPRLGRPRRRAAPALAAPALGGVARATADTTQRFDDDVTSPTDGTDYFSYPTSWARGCCFGDLYATDVHYALTGGAPAVFTFTGTGPPCRRSRTSTRVR